jgi:lipoprotein-releasing system permease protein
MFKPLSSYIGLRYTRAKRKNHFISFISLMSMIGIALGVTVLITVLSVMNGFDSHIRDKVFGMAPAISLSTMQGQLPQWQSWQTKLQKNPQVVASAPFVDGQGLLRDDGQVAGVEVQGIDPVQEEKINDLNHKIIDGTLTKLKPGSFGIVLGKTLAENLGAGVGDKITLFVPKLTVSPAGIMPRFKRFTVQGIFSAGSGFGFDTNLAFINLHDAQVLFVTGSNATGLNLKIKDMYQAPHVASDIVNQYQGLTATDWTQTYGALFKAVALEKTMMFLILILIVAVAAFNLVSSLVMVVTDKQADIAILRTMGATPGMIMRIFMVQGSLVGVIGTLLGLLGGVTLALNVTRLVNWLQAVLHKQIFQGSVYYLNYLPSQVKYSDVVQIIVVALLMSLLATIYPAWRAARVQRAEALRYD